MAALTSNAPFSNALKPACSHRSTGCQRRTLACRAQARDSAWHQSVGVQLLAAGLAATTLLSTPSIAEAKVQFVEPKTKKVFQSKPKAPQPPPTEGSEGGGGLQLPSIGLPSLPTPNLSGLNISPGDGLDPRSIALPGAIVGLTAAAFAAYKLDPGFKDMMRNGLVKDSGGYAGYEEAVDEYASQAAGAVGKGTKKISKAANKTASKVKGKAKGGLGGLFGRK